VLKEKIKKGKIPLFYFYFNHRFHNTFSLKPFKKSFIKNASQKKKTCAKRKIRKEIKRRERTTRMRFLSEQE